MNDPKTVLVSFPPVASADAQAPARRHLLTVEEEPSPDTEPEPVPDTEPSPAPPDMVG